MMWGYGYTFSWPGMLFMMIVGLILCIALIAAIVWLFMRLSSHRNATPQTTPQSSMELLEQRYARGELDPQTYEQMRERLQEGMPEQVRR